MTTHSVTLKKCNTSDENPDIKIQSAFLVTREVIDVHGIKAISINFQ